MVTATPGGVIGGYWAIGNENSAIAPVRVMTIDSTAAKIGRSMKKREIMAAPLSRQGVKESPLTGRPALLISLFSGLLVSWSPGLLVSWSPGLDWGRASASAPRPAGSACA